MVEEKNWLVKRGEKVGSGCALPTGGYGYIPVRFFITSVCEAEDDIMAALVFLIPQISDRILEVYTGMGGG